MSDGIDKGYLKQIVDATTAGTAIYIGQVMGQPMLAHNPPLIEINPAVTNPADPTQVICRSLPAAADYLAAPVDGAGAATASKYEVISNVKLPAAKRRGNPSHGGPSKYPFESMEIGAAFFSPDTEHKKGNAVKALGSTVSSQNKKFSEQVVKDGVPQTKTVTRAVRDKQTHKAVLGPDGKKQTETVTLPVLDYTRKFTIRPVEAGVKYGEWVAPSNGALIGRSK